MGNTSWQSGYYVNSTETLRGLGSGFSTAFETAGFVHTSDTGQADWDTITYPSGGYVSWGQFAYEMFRFDDSLQSTNPIFIKLSYSPSTLAGGGASYTGLTISIGSSTNGAGVLSGYGTPGITVMNPGGSGQVYTYTNYAAGDGSGIALVTMLDAAQAAATSVFAIDRFRDSLGNPSGDGVWLFGKSKANTTGANNFMVDTTSQYGKALDLGKGSAVFPIGVNASSTASISGTTYFSPYKTMIPNGGGVYNQKMFLTYPSADYGYNNNLSITHLGQARTYKTMGSYIGYMDVGAQAYMCAAMYWSD